MGLGLGLGTDLVTFPAQRAEKIIDPVTTRLDGDDVLEVKLQLDHHVTPTTKAKGEGMVVMTRAG